MNENVSELFDELIAASTSERADEAYRTLRFVLNRTVDIALRNSTIQFSGLFAKINYLLSEKQAQPEFVHSMGSTRNRIRHQDEISETDLTRYLPYDIKNLSTFIGIVLQDVEIPEALAKHFPKGALQEKWSRASAGYLRVYVKSAEHDIIQAIADEAGGNEVQIYYGSGNKYLQFDYSYLTPLLKEGVQLNLIRPRQGEDGTLLPEIIIYEPDYLIDISSIASSFKEYGVTPLTNLLNKISPSRQTKATLLGEYASQLLDEELHGKKDRPYAESIMSFCKSRAISMSACDELDGSFHKDAAVQKKNIHKAISQDLPQTISTFQPKEIILEPSFACEMLGIQGRMDFLQSDNSILIEQKSGKAAFVPGQQGFHSPIICKNHYVQLLLYRAMLHYNYNLPNESIRPLLLYSKYDNPLVQTDSAPELLYEAFRLRNQLVWLELHLSDEGFSVLTTLTPEVMNKDQVQSKLWNQYTRPDIERELLPIHNATELERSYYLRMLQFVQREQVLSKIGTKRKENSGYASRWHDSLEEKIQAGNIYDRLTLAPLSDEEGIYGVTVHFDEERTQESANFRKGDIVTLFPYKLGTEPDCRTTIIHRASIESISSEGLVLRLRATQTNKHVFDTKPGWVWAIEHDFMESAFSSQYRGIHSFLSASQERKNLILTQRHPIVDSNQEIIGDYTSFNELASRLVQAQELFLIIGPPGTGKTSFGMLYTLKEELQHKGSSVAVMAFTNRAVDEICSKLVEEGLDFIRIGNELSSSEEYRPYFLSTKTEGIKKISEIRDVIRSQRIIVGTTTAFSSNSALFDIRDFSLAIIDEASQILEPQLLGILSAQHAGHEAVRKFVLIGDHKQLPAVVMQTPEESAVEEECLREIGLEDCRSSLFERLLTKYKDDPSVVYLLNHQGRMHQDIADFPNEHFYEGKLACVPLPHQVAESLKKRVVFIDVPRETESHSDKVNMAEAEVIANIVKEYVSEGNTSTDDIGIIVPYRNQIAAISKAIGKFSESLPTIDTVERFQGSQREIIIYGFTVKRPYQLDFLTDNCFTENGRTIDRKLNVVLTRARKQIYLVGNAELLKRNTLFAELIDHCS